MQKYLQEKKQNLIFVTINAKLLKTKLPMKKLFVTLLIAAVSMVASFQAKAIEDPFQKGTLIFGAQFGALPGIGGTLYGDCVLVDSWWKGHFTVGGQIGYRYWSAYSYHDLGVMARATYGLNITQKFEVHAGTLIGLGDHFYNHSSVLGLAYGGLVGLRLFFSESVALSVEANYSGYGPYLNAGLAFKL